ncbi:MAG: response regulator [Blastocatellia bacterium]
MKQTYPTRVLLVNDDSDDYILVRDMLEDAARDYTVTCVWTPSAAIEAIDSGIHDVCLVDWRLGAQSGLELLRDIRQRGCTIPAILLTGSGGNPLDEEDASALAWGHLIKSEMSPAELDRCICAAIPRA